MSKRASCITAEFRHTYGPDLSVSAEACFGDLFEVTVLEVYLRGLAQLIHLFQANDSYGAAYTVRISNVSASKMFLERRGILP